MKVYLIFILILVSVSSCYKESDYTKPLSPDLFKITAISNSILADSFSTAKITVEIPVESADSLLQITFKTTSGIFVDAGQKIITVKAKKTMDGLSRIAEAILKSSNSVDTAVVSVELFDFKQSVKVYFAKSYPEKLQLFASTLSVKPANNSTGEVNIDALITKINGYPSVGNIIDLKGYDSSFNKRLGSFRVYNNQSNYSGRTNYVFVLGDSIFNKTATSYIGSVYLIGIASSNTSNQFLSDTIKLISSR